MGIECFLLRVGVSSKTRERLALAMAERIRTGVANLTGRLDGCRELCGANSQHRAARAELEAVEVRNRVGRQDRMASLRGVEGCAV
jgi:hypothetical protein